MTLFFNGIGIGVEFSNALTGNFSVSGQIPAGTLPGVYAVAVDDGGGPFGVCSVTVQALAPTPTPVPTAAPTATPDPDDDDDIDADTLADIIAALADGDGGGQQQQQQQQAIPVALPVAGVGSVGGGSKLPKTGVDAAEVGGIGTASLLAGVSLMEFARRRRRHWLQPMTAAEAMATTPRVPVDVPVMPVGGEGDLLLPYGSVAQSEAPRAPEPDIITPSF